MLTFAMKLKIANDKSRWDILLFYDQWKIMSDLNICHGNMSDFVSFPLFGFTLVIKLGNFDFESHVNTLIFFDKKRYVVRFEYIPLKYVWFCFIFIASVHFSHKTEKFRFWKSLKYFNVLYEKMMSDLIMSCQTVSVLV